MEKVWAKSKQDFLEQYLDTFPKKAVFFYFLTEPLEDIPKKSMEKFLRKSKEVIKQSLKKFFEASIFKGYCIENSTGISGKNGECFLNNL